MSAGISDAELEALNQRGIALANDGALHQAAEVFQQAARARPDSYKPHANLALVWRRLLRMGDAVAALQEAVRLSPENARLTARLAQAALDSGSNELASASAIHAYGLAATAEHALLAARATFAAESFEQALRFAKLTPPPHGRVIETASLLLLGRPVPAQASIDAGDISVDGLLQILGVALDGRVIDVASTLVERLSVIAKSREQAALFAVLAADHARRRGEALEARALLAGVDEPALANDGLLRLHRAWVELGDPTQAAAVTDRALRGTAADLEILQRDGESALSADRPDIARMRFEQCLRLAPGDASARIALARARATLGEAQAALVDLDRLAVEMPLDPRPSYHAIFARLHSLPEAPLELRERLSMFSERFLVAPCTAAQRPRDLSPERRLRVGYLSADVQDHAVMRFASGLLREHDRQAFDVHCYSAGKKRDAVTQALAELPLSFHDVHGLSAELVAARIVADEIDLLVDLGGHTSDLLRVFAQRPAPVQLTWLGFPATTGLGAVDIRISDWRADPAGCDAFCSERIVRLPESAWSFEEKLSIPIAQRPRGAPIVFGSFNRAMKLSDELLSAWGAILAALPGSVLALKGRGLSSTDGHARIERALARAGIDPSVLRWSGMLVDRKQHLAAWNEIDVCLDTFPYAGTTTTCEALFMGVPVVTRTGESHVSRVGASLLAEVGLDDLVTPDWARYREAALGIARDHARRAELRLGLRGRLAASALGSAQRFTRAFERLLRDAWRGYAESGSAGAEVNSRRLGRLAPLPDLYTDRDLAEQRVFMEHEGRVAPDAAWAVAATKAGDDVLLIDPPSAAHALTLLDAVGEAGALRVVAASPAVATSLRAAGRSDVRIDDGAPPVAPRLIEAPLEQLIAMLDASPAWDPADVLARISDLAPAAPALDALAGRGLTLLGLMPGLDALSSAAALRSTGRFVAGSRRLEALARAGSLVTAGSRRPAGAGAARARACLEACGLGAAPPREAVSLYLQSLEGSLDLAARAALLERAFEASAEVAADDPVGAALTRARLAFELGMSDEVESALAAITSDERAPEHRFLAAHPEYEVGPRSGQTVARWALLQALERRVLEAATSFDRRQSHRELIARFFQAGGQSRELNRRLGLLLALGNRPR